MSKIGEAIGIALLLVGGVSIVAIFVSLAVESVMKVEQDSAYSCTYHRTGETVVNPDGL